MIRFIFWILLMTALSILILSIVLGILFSPWSWFFLLGVLVAVLVCFLIASNF